MSWFIVFSVIAILILLTALYVGAEFSAVSARRARLIQLAEGGKPQASNILHIIEDPRKLDAYIAACQIGITLTGLLLGFYGQAQLSPIIVPWLMEWAKVTEVAARSISTTSILLLLTSVQVLLGELVPKNIGIQYPESLAIWTAIPMQWSMWLFQPLTWFFNGSGQLVMRLFGQEIIAEHAHIHAPDEITMLVEESTRGGLLEREERHLLKNTLELREAMVRQVMIPRTQMFAAADNLSADDLFKYLAESPFSRLPLYRGNIDNIVGIVHLKDLLCLHQHLERKNIADIVRPVPFFPETTPVKTVFTVLQRRHLQAAIVLDEYGGTAGMVTLEDLIEEIFGEIQDEFDVHIPAYRLASDNRLMIRGDTLVEDLNERLELELPEEELDTIGGLVLNEFGDVPTTGDEITIAGGVFRVEKMRGRGITVVSLALTPDQVTKLREGEA
ncbi:MAG: HlyC/CorC family transporter [Anaerolineales bacterium]|nr:HlyC/CorC family transporter [Anaerolineales bacterium]